MFLQMLWALFIAYNPPLQAAEKQVSTLHVCIEDKTVFPLYNKPGTEKSKSAGILIDYLIEAAKKAHFQIEITRRSATACPVLVKSGEVDAYGLISHTQERRAWAHYPTLAGGAIDPSLAFNQAGYYLYSRNDRNLSWDGESLASLKQARLGAIEGYGIVDELRKYNIPVETFKSLDAMITRLNDKQLDGIAVHSKRIDKRILKEGLKKYEKPLKMNDYFLVFSRSFYKMNPEFCQTLWKDSAQFEQSPLGKEFMQRYDAQEDF